MAASAPSPAQAALATLRARNARWAAFAVELLVDDDAGAAYKRAGFTGTGRGAIANAHKLRHNPEVAPVIALLQAERDAAVGITAERVLEQWWMIATADPNELIDLRRTCCRHCYGEGHGYQRTAGEIDRARADWEAVERKKAKAERQPFDEMGGSGYDARLAPHPECPECFGEGVAQVFPKDSRDLSPAARLLYAGVKQTRDGVEIKMRDQDAALVNVAQHIGMFVKRVEQSGDSTVTVRFVSE